MQLFNFSMFYDPIQRQTWLKGRRSHRFPEETNSKPCLKGLQDPGAIEVSQASLLTLNEAMANGRTYVHNKRKEALTINYNNDT